MTNPDERGARAPVSLDSDGLPDTWRNLAPSTTLETMKTVAPLTRTAQV